jgi:16S rRNA (cytosine967-C5)-methyltransferase
VSKSPSGSASTTVATKNIRAVALAVLLRFERNKKQEQRLKADSLIADQLRDTEGEISPTDRRFLHALVLGTLRQQAFLDAWIEVLSGRSLKQLEPVVRVLLRLGLFQLHALHQVPAYAAIDTTVQLTRSQTRNPRTVKFVNAILRQAQRQQEAGDLLGKSETDPVLRLVWRYAWPEAWTRLLLQSYSVEQVEAMAQASQHVEVETPSAASLSEVSTDDLLTAELLPQDSVPPVPVFTGALAIRVNTLKTTPEAYQQALRNGNVSFQPLPDGPGEGLLLTRMPGSVRDLPGYAEGWFYVQDAASMWVGRLVDPQPGEMILDMCAAPGSKTSHMAALAQNRALITALDPVERRVALLHENIARLGLENITVVQADALMFVLPVEYGSGYDKVLVDAPCSGSGTLRRHPEILRQLASSHTATILESLIAQQLALLEKALTCLKPGGILIYSTCSILPPENAAVIQTLRQRHPELTLLFEKQRLIQPHADGFYAAMLRMP